MVAVRTTRACSGRWPPPNRFQPWRKTSSRSSLRNECPRCTPSTTEVRVEPVAVADYRGFRRRNSDRFKFAIHATSVKSKFVGRSLDRFPINWEMMTVPIWCCRPCSYRIRRAVPTWWTINSSGICPKQIGTLCHKTLQRHDSGSPLKSSAHDQLP